MDFITDLVQIEFFGTTLTYTSEDLNIFRVQKGISFLLVLLYYREN